MQVPPAYMYSWSRLPNRADSRSSYRGMWERGHMKLSKYNLGMPSNYIHARIFLFFLINKNFFKKHPAFVKMRMLFVEGLDNEF